MELYAGLDVGLKVTSICVVTGEGRLIWRGKESSRPEAIARALAPFAGGLAKVGLESGSLSPYLCRGLAGFGLPVVCLDARRAADAIRARRVKTDEGDARALAEMLRTGWYTPVHVKSEASHRIKALLGARDQLVRSKRAIGNQIRGLLRPFGIRLPARQGTKRFAEAVAEAVAHDAVLRTATEALLAALAALEGEVARLDEEVRDLARRSHVCWRLMSIPGVGPITALAFVSAVDDIGRFTRLRDLGAYLGLTPGRYQSSETDVRLGITRQGDTMARHYLYEAANVLLTTVRRRSALKSWGLQLVKRRGPKRARVAVARKLACLMGRLWREKAHFEPHPAG